eukprot:1160381-Pelagomonas_calceolata.AAC.10
MQRHCFQLSSQLHAEALLASELPGCTQALLPIEQPSASLLRHKPRAGQVQTLIHTTQQAYTNGASSIGYKQVLHTA